MRDKKLVRRGGKYLKAQYTGQELSLEANIESLCLSVLDLWSLKRDGQTLRTYSPKPMIWALRNVLYRTQCIYF